MSIDIQRSAESLAADPAFTSTYAPRSCLYLPGTAGNYAATPDTAALDITGDIDIRAVIALDDWSPAAAAYIGGKGDLAGSQLSYLFNVETSGALRLLWSPNGSTLVSAVSLANLSALAAGTVRAVAATLDVDNGSSARTAQFYTYDGSDPPDDLADWTPLGLAVGAPGVTSIHSGTTELRAGNIVNPSSGMVGKLYRFQVRDGIGGSLVADFDARAPMGDRFRDSTGKVWTLTGSAWSWMVA